MGRCFGGFSFLLDDLEKDIVAGASLFEDVQEAKSRNRCGARLEWIGLK